MTRLGTVQVPNRGRMVSRMVIQCGCGHKLTLVEFTNQCAHCHAEYNSSGQRLAPRDQWGEETGESAADILALGYHEE